MFSVCILAVVLALGPNLCPAIEVMYENIEQINGTDFIDFQVRVHKINRTHHTLYGNITLLQPINDDYNVSLDFFHSAKGNQQFNHYPMKIPSTKVCEFIGGAWAEYRKYYEKQIDNLLEVAECPIEPRSMEVNDHLLDAGMLSEYAPTGLWKVHTAVQTEAGEGFFVIWYFKIYEDGHFG